MQQESVLNAAWRTVHLTNCSFSDSLNSTWSVGRAACWCSWFNVNHSNATAIYTLGLSAAWSVCRANFIDEHWWTPENVHTSRKKKCTCADAARSVTEQFAHSGRHFLLESISSTFSPNSMHLTVSYGSFESNRMHLKSIWKADKLSNSIRTIQTLNFKVINNAVANDRVLNTLGMRLQRRLPVGLYQVIGLDSSSDGSRRVAGRFYRLNFSCKPICRPSDWMQSLHCKRYLPYWCSSAVTQVVT